MKNSTIGIFIFLIIWTVLSLSVSADKEMIIDDFNSENPLLIWGPGDAVLSVQKVNYTSDFTNTYLSVIGDNSDAQIVKTVHAIPKDTLALSEYKYLMASIKVDDFVSSNTDCYVKMIVKTSDGKKAESIKTLHAGKWQNVSVDISSLKNRSDISEIEIGVVPDQTDFEFWSGGFSVDNIIAYGYIDPLLSTRFSMDEYELENAEIEFSNDNSFFELTPLSEEEGFKFKFHTNGTIKNYTNALRINLENNTDCRDLNVLLYDENGTLIKGQYEALENGITSQILYIEMPNPEKVDKIVLDFPTLRGSVKIYSMEFTDTYVNSQYITYGTVASCTFNEDENVIIIEGNISEEYVNEFSDLNIMLYALELNEDAKRHDYKQNSEIFSQPISEYFSFEIDTAKLGRKYLTKKFVIIIDSAPRVFVSNPFYVDQAQTYISEQDLILGIASDNSFTVGDSGAATTVLDVQLDRLIALKNGGEPYFYENKYYYFNSAYAERLKKSVKALTSSGVKITVRISVKSPDNDKLVYSADEERYGNYLPNIANESGYSYYKAAVSFISNKCGITQNGRCGIDSFIIGQNVNSGNSISYAPEMSLTELTNTYANLMRLAYLACDSQNILIYASVDDVLEHTLIGNTSNRYDSLVFLSALSEAINLEGDFPWGVCVESDSLDAWDEPTDKRFSVDNGYLAKSLLESEKVRTQNLSRPIMVVETLESPTVSPTSYAAEVLSKLTAYNIASFKGRYIIDCQNCDSDIKELLVYYFKCFISDDTEELEKIDFDMDSYTSFKYAAPKVFVERSTLDAYTQNDKQFLGTHTFFDFYKNYQLSDWSRLYNSQALKLSLTDGETTALNTLLRKDQLDPENTPFAITYCPNNEFSFKYTPILSADINLKSANTETVSQSAKLVVRFIGDNLIHDVSAELEIGKEQTLYADLSSISEKTFTSVQIFISANDVSQLELNIDNIIGYSENYDSETLNKLISEKESDRIDSKSSISPSVIIVFALAITVLSTLTVILQLRKKALDKHS